MKQSNVPIIDLYTFTANLGTDLYCDHVHFHDPIRQKQASFIAGWLAAFIKTIPNVDNDRDNDY